MGRGNINKPSSCTSFQLLFLQGLTAVMLTRPDQSTNSLSAYLVDPETCRVGIRPILLTRTSNIVLATNYLVVI